MLHAYLYTRYRSGGCNSNIYQFRHNILHFKIKISEALVCSSVRQSVCVIWFWSQSKFLHRLQHSIQPSRFWAIFQTDSLPCRILKSNSTSIQCEMNGKTTYLWYIAQFKKEKRGSRWKRLHCLLYQSYEISQPSVLTIFPFKKRKNCSKENLEDLSRPGFLQCDTTGVSWLGQLFPASI